MAKEPWILYVCNSHFEFDKQTHHSSNTEVFPETGVLFTQLPTLNCSICHQSKSLYNQHLCPKHIINILDKKCQIPCDSTFDKQSVPLQTPTLHDCFVCKSCSGSITLSRTIQVPHELRCQFSINPFLKETYHAMVTKFLYEMTGWSIAVDQPNSLKFQFSPKRCDRQNLNERLLHLFLQDSELHYQVYILNSKVNILGSLGKVEEQTISDVCSQLYTILKRTEDEKICCGVYDSNILTWAKQKIGSPEPPQFIVDSVGNSFKERKINSAYK